MTDRLKGCYVTFDRDIRVDDAEPILNAIRMISHVQEVSTQLVDMTDWSARVQVRCELEKEILDVLSRRRGEAMEL